MANRTKQDYIKLIALGIGAFSGFMQVAAVVLVLLNRGRLAESLGFEHLVFSLNATATVVLALLILFRSPRQMVGWLFMLIGLFFAWWVLSSIAYSLSSLEQLPGFIRLLVSLGMAAYFPPILITFGLVPLFFPDGKLPSRSWWPVLAVISVGFVGQAVAVLGEDILVALTNAGGARRGMKLGSATLLLSSLEDISSAILIFGIIGGLASLVFRFHRSRGVERMQMKWLVYTATLTITGVLLMSIFLGEDSFILSFFSSLTPTYLSIAIGLAILRFRLYDIDIIIRRTLQYALLTAVLAGLYFGGVVLLQAVVGGLSGDSASPLVTVITTLAIAALFNPLRIRIQNFIDRRFYRARYDAEKTLEGFAAAARDEVDMGRLTGTLLGVVEETMQPEQISLWIKR